ncbi:hypothetical protein TSUD_298530 [Trifolium subterraneum]|nr:hypothetical protein TSUD_298530 [Trifolium subterraneum]
MQLHCEGCTQRIYKIVLKAKGVNMVTIDKELETVIVEGTMDVKVLIDKLEKKFKRKVVELVQPEKIKDEKKKKNKEGEGENKKGGDGNCDDNNAKMEVSTSGYGYDFFGQVQMMPMQAPQMFSDENPNACSVM